MYVCSSPKLLGDVGEGLEREAVRLLLFGRDESSHCGRAPTPEEQKGGILGRHRREQAKYEVVTD